ncbi:AraC family transcriptional regulator [Pseudoclavibacter sp. AY1H1]|uniref:helix-turn-helix domain-containing protein n=1 Tax=Pseudoclavibacter sp. AY1H1 TaxID=2080584 RepID=UPI001C67A36A|nr:helix-turn-helix transcriptional regulator [Pseudoclavibacter sp. AY1H1]
MNDSTVRLQHLEPKHVIRFLGHPTHAHDVPHLIYVAVGIAHLTVDEVSMTLRAQESVWLAAGVPHAARYGEGSLVLGPFLDAEHGPPVPVLKLGVVPAVSTLMMTILGVAPQTRDQVIPLREALGRTLQGLVASHFVLVLPRHPTAARIARAAAASGRTLAELATAEQISVRQIQRVFLEETGLSFQRWRSLARLNIAIARLRGSEPLAQVARGSGYLTRSGLMKALERELSEADLQSVLGRSTT